MAPLQRAEDVTMGPNTTGNDAMWKMIVARAHRRRRRGEEKAIGACGANNDHPGGLGCSLHQDEEQRGRREDGVSAMDGNLRLEETIGGL